MQHSQQVKISLKALLAQVWQGHSLYRAMTHLGLSAIALEGRGLDLGAGSVRPSYAAYLDARVSAWTYTDYYQSADGIIPLDLEKPFELSQSYDAIICLNVAEHIYHSHHLFASIAKHLAPKGKLVMATPFLFPLHPSPHDYWRFTPESFAKLASDNGLEIQSVTFLGKGPFVAALAQIWQVCPKWLRFIATSIAWSLDSLLLANSKMFTQTHALGFIALMHSKQKRRRRLGP